MTDEVTDEVMNGVTNMPGLVSGAGVPPVVASDPLRAEWPASILIADDDPSALRILRRVLEGAGYVVLEATDGEQVRSILAETTPELLVLDISMPGADGIALSREVKSNPATSLIPSSTSRAPRAGRSASPRWRRVRTSSSPSRSTSRNS